MPINKDALTRYRIIDQALCSKANKYPSLKDLQKIIEDRLGIEVSLRTIQEDLREMRHNEGLNFNAPIEYIKSVDGYRYTDPSYSITKPPISEKDLKSLKFAANLISKFKDIPYLEDIQKPIEQLERIIEIGKTSGTWANNAIVQLEYPEHSIDNELFKKLINAINNKQACMIKYKAFNKPESRAFKINPYLIKEYKNRWYLVALNVDYNDIRVYGLERISNLLILDEYHDNQFAHEDYFKYALGITVQNNVKPIIVKLQFDNIHGPYILSNPLHHTQKTIKSTKNHLTISIQVYPSAELSMLLLSHGSGVKVLKPDWLRDEIHAEAKKILKII